MKLYKVSYFEEGMYDYVYLCLTVAENEAEAEKKIIEECGEDAKDWDLLLWEVKIEGYEIKIEEK